MSSGTRSRGALRVLDVIRSLDPASGGPAEGLRQMCRATRRMGHQEDVLTLDAPGAPWLEHFPARLHVLGPGASTYGYTGALVPWLRTHGADYDAVIVHGLWQYPGLAVRRALRGLALPYFVFPHGMLDPWFRHAHPLKHLKKALYWPCAEYRVLRDAAGVLFTTAEEARLATQSFSPYQARPVTLGYGLALDDEAVGATAEDFLQAFPRLRGRRLLLFLGRLHPKKGCDLLIEAFARCAAADPLLALVMAGPDTPGCRTSLEALAIRLGVADRICWTGMLQGRQKWGALRAADVFVLSSHQENFGIAVAEALALGLPVLVSRQVNTWHDVVEEGAGFAAPDTVDGTHDMLQRWLALDESARGEMRRSARRCFQNRFHVDAAATRLVELVRSSNATPRQG